jgi:translation initiation factor 4E
MSNEYLNDIWAYYYHDPFDTNWNFESYVKLDNISDINDFWTLHNTVIEKINSGMFFLMREHVFPCWDDENNVNGGCFTIKIFKQSAQTFWEEISIRLLGETLFKDNKNWDYINGISISPKKSFCIVKIWMRNNEIKDHSLLNIPDNIYGDILYKSNKEFIANDAK